MSKPRKALPPWTATDDRENTRRIQAVKDAALWLRVGRRLGLSGKDDFRGVLGRLIDERLAAAFSQPNNYLLQQLNSAADVDALRGALSDHISDEVAEMFQILTGQGTNDERSDKEETSGSGGENAAFEQREIYGDEAEEAEAGDGEGS